MSSPMYTYLFLNIWNRSLYKPLQEKQSNLSAFSMEKLLWIWRLR